MLTGIDRRVSSVGRMVDNFRPPLRWDFGGGRFCNVTYIVWVFDQVRSHKKPGEETGFPELEIKALAPLPRQTEHGACRVCGCTSLERRKAKTKSLKRIL